MAGDVVPVRYLAVVAPGQGGPGGYGRTVDVTVLAGEPGVLEACLDGLGRRAAVTLAAAATV